MNIVSNIPPEIIYSPKELARLATGYLHAVVEVNRMIMRRVAVPWLLYSGVRWRREPWSGRFEEFANYLTCLKRGWGDCDDIAGIRVAERKERFGDENCKFEIYWRDDPVTGMPGFHAMVYPGKVCFPGDSTLPEDPSRWLGMGAI